MISFCFLVKQLEIEDNDVVVVSRRNLPHVQTTDQAVQTDPIPRAKRRRRSLRENQAPTNEHKYEENPVIIAEKLSNTKGVVVMHQVTADCQAGDDESHSSDKSVSVNLEDQVENQSELRDNASDHAEILAQHAGNHKNNSDTEEASDDILPAESESWDKDVQGPLKHTQPREYVYLGEFEPTVEEITSL